MRWMLRAPGRPAAKYETLRRLAVGGMGEIFLAREHGRLGFSRLVVIKRMLPDRANDPVSVEMFVDEARIVGHLAHPNICQILELGDEDGMPFLALEYVRGKSLSEIWDRAHVTFTEIPRATTLRMLADTALALHFAHEACDADGRRLNVIHRDISPHNVMVSFHGDVKLMDFGIARADNRSHRTDTGKVKGKISYMSPEQLRGDVLDPRADVFAVGIMLWELTLGRRLFGGGGEVETLRKALACEVPPPRSIDPEYPPALEAIVMSALAVDRNRRTASAGELAHSLIEQVAALGGAERSEIAEVIRRLFPVERAEPDDSRPTLSWQAAPDTQPDAGIAGLVVASTLRLVSPGVREGRTTVPLRAETPKPHDAAPPVGAIAPVVQPTARRRRSKRVIVAAALGLGLAATVATVLALGSREADPSHAITYASPGVPADAARSASAAPPMSAPAPAPTPVLNQLAPSEPRANLPVQSAGKPAAPPRIAVRAAATRPTPSHNEPIALAESRLPTTAPKTTAMTAAAAVAGTLAVSSIRTAVVVIDGRRYKSTPFQTELAAGAHEVTLELAEGAGTLRAGASVSSGKKTKCKANSTELVCVSAP